MEETTPIIPSSYRTNGGVPSSRLWGRVGVWQPRAVPPLIRLDMYYIPDGLCADNHSVLASRRRLRLHL